MESKEKVSIKYDTTEEFLLPNKNFILEPVYILMRTK